MLNLTNYLRAAFQILFIETQEIKRCVNSIEIDQFIDEEITRKISWDIISGVHNTPENDFRNDSLGILNYIKGFPAELTTFVLENYDQQIKDDFILQQTLLNLSEEIKQTRKMIVIVGSDFNNIPKTLEKVITKIEFDLPKVELFEQLIKEYSEQTGVEVQDINSIAESCKGLSFIEAENAIAFSLAETQGFDKKKIIEMKRSMIKKTGSMDIMEPEPIENIGGLENLKEYIIKRKEAWEPESIKPKLRSIFLSGIPGTGKSLISKAIASIFNWPLISLDIGSVKGSLVGESEKNIRQVTKIIDAVGHVILTIEEIEKSLGGSSQNLDSGVTLGLVGYLLTWLQESKGEKILVATCNDITLLNGEFLRAGRWDSLWFVDFPTFTERKQIIEIKNRIYKSEIPTDDNFVRSLNNWTGAEIEQLAKDWHFSDNIEQAMENVPLLYKTRSDTIQQIKERSKGMMIANNKREEVTEDKRQERKITINKDKSDDLTDLKAKIKRKILLK